MPTPFVGDEVDRAAIAFNIDRWMRAGLGGVVALGTNGESGLLAEDESDLVVGAARDAVPSGKLLIAGAGRESTRATVAAARRAAALGADMVLVRTPSFFRTQMTPAVLLRHFTTVADSSPVPVLLYNFPAQTGVNFAPDTIATLAAHPNITGLKETGTDAAQLAGYAEAAAGANFSILVGSAPGFYAGLCVGAVGGIVAAACVLPELCVRLHTAARAGGHAEARALQRQITPIGVLVTATYGVPGLKAALDASGYKGGEPRAPLVPLASEGKERIRLEVARLQQPA
jgi:4-hydroxy-2-oxoglutarate aldolase